MYIFEQFSLMIRNTFLDIINLQKKTTDRLQVCIFIYLGGIYCEKGKSRYCGIGPFGQGTR